MSLARHIERWYCGIRVLRNLLDLDSLPKKNKKMPRCNKLRRGVFCMEEGKILQEA